ncbi:MULTISPECIES: ATP-binding protein [Chitinophagaceae]
MKIKVKLTLWVGLLFAMIVVLSMMSSIYINRLKYETVNILRANDNSMEYSRQMLAALDDMETDPVNGRNVFGKNLKLQIQNCTEPGEQSYTDDIDRDFEKMSIHGDTSWLTKRAIRKDINQIMLLNMNAIQRKNAHAVRTAENATVSIIITATLCFIIAFVLLYNLPGNIANPIKELTNSIRQIAAHNYQERVHFEQHNEFGLLAKSFNIMAEKLEEYSNSSLAKILTEKKRIDTLIDNMQDPVIGLNEENTVQFINEKALKIAGLERSQIVGKDVRNVALTNDLVRSLVKELYTSNGVACKTEPVKIFADGKESYFEKEIVSIEIVPTGETIAQQAGHVILLRNITPFKELDIAKTNFIANVSHELKTPIASIKMGTQLLRLESGQSREELELITGINEDADRLLKITGELLNMTQAETGNVHLKKVEYPLEELIQYATDAIKVLAGSKDVTLHIETIKNLTIYADKEKTLWVLTNLLTNAIRYSPEHTEISLSAREGQGKVRIEVSDQGPGIDEKYREKIFDRYYQIPGTSESGTGLGLSICREFIEAQGGVIGVVPNVSGIGSTFYFEV